METVYRTFRSLLLPTLAAAVLLLAGCGGGEKEDQPIPAASNSERLTYLTELGWQVEPEPLHTVVLRLPHDLAEDYGDYLKLQEEQALPFAQCAGRTVSRYTYAATNYPGYDGPVQIDLWVCDGALCGGDVTAPGEGGFQDGIKFPG